MFVALPFNKSFCYRTFLLLLKLEKRSKRNVWKCVLSSLSLYTCLYHPSVSRHYTSNSMWYNPADQHNVVVFLMYLYLITSLNIQLSSFYANYIINYKFLFFTSSHRKCNFIIIITYQVTFLIGEFIHLFFQLQVLLCQVFHHLFSSECSINLSSYTTNFMKHKQTPPKNPVPHILYCYIYNIGSTVM